VSRILLSKRFLIAAGAAALVIAGVAIAAYSYYHGRTGSVFHPHARFVPEALPPPVKAPTPVSHFKWPLYGYTPDHTRYFPAPANLRPPLTEVWRHHGDALLEFPPVIHDQHIFQLADNGLLQSINKYNGHTTWQRSLGSLSASTPAIDDSTVYVTLMQRSPNTQVGRVVALDQKGGKIRWLRDLASPSESSPLLDGGRLYFGSQNGTVYALDASNGRVIWTYHAGGAVKASPTLKNGVLYFGDYSGQVQAIRERTGRRLWSSGSGGAVLGSGQFYSTAAAVYGRLYLGNTDGRIYAYDQSSGRLDWAVQTGAYVYSSPAVANAPGLGPTIYMGSYDGTFRALDAHTGSVRWQFNAGGRISGSATILGRIVYFADLGHFRTYGLGISTGHPQLVENTGTFDPVVTDGARIYLTGYSDLSAFAPNSELAHRAASPHPAAAHAAAHRGGRASHHAARRSDHRRARHR
jgi:outer membrane protein assembly factor BamB